jgi:lambda family phage portal protein
LPTTAAPARRSGPAPAAPAPKLSLAQAKEAAEQARFEASAAADTLRAVTTRRAIELYQSAGGAGKTSLAGSYEGAKRTRLKRGGWGNVVASGDAHRDYATLEDVWKGTEELQRNKPLVRGNIQRLKDMVVSDGFSVQADTGDDAVNELYEEYFNEFADRLDGTGADVSGLSTLDEMAADCVSAGCVHGDRLILMLESGSLQVVEAPRIVNPGRRRDTKTLRSGVEINGVGLPVAYHIADWNEQGTYIDAKSTARRDAKYALHFRNPLQNATLRGEPQLVSSLQRHEDLEEYELAVRAAARMAACYGLVTYTDRPADFQAMLTGETEDGEGGIAGSQQKEVEWAPGMVAHLRPGDKAEQINPNQPGTNFQDFVFVQVMMMGVDVAMPLFLSLLDGRQVNLASMRSLLAICFRNYFRWQRALELRLYRPVYRFRIAYGIRKGDIPFTEKWARHSWSPPPPPMMDAAAEIKAGRDAIDARMKAPRRVVRELFGLDFKREMKAMAEDLKALEKNGIAMVGVPGANAGGGGGGGPGGSAPGAENQTDPETGEPKKPAEGDESAGGGGDKSGAKPGKAAGAGTKAEGVTPFLIGDKTGAIDLATKVAGKVLPAESAKAVLEEMVGLSTEQSARIIDPAASHQQPAPEPAPEP